MENKSLRQTNKVSAMVGEYMSMRGIITSENEYSLLIHPKAWDVVTT